MTAAPPSAVGTRGARRLATDSATVSAWTLVSRVLGLVRVVIIGAALGPTFFANTFQAGYTVPNLVFTVIAGPVLAMVAVPAVVRSLGADGQEGARLFLARLAGALLAASGLLAAAVVLASPLIAWSLTVGIPEAAGRARAQDLTLLLVVLVAPQVVLYTIAGLAVAAQQARGRFALAAAAPAVENVVVIAAVVAAAGLYGQGLEADHVPVAMVVLLGLGSTLGVAVHAGLQLFGTARAGLLVGPRRGGRVDPEVRSATARILRSVPVAACPAAATYLLLVAAGTVPGGVFVVQLAVTVFYALSYLGPRAVAMAVLPGLATSAHAGDRASFAAGWRRGLTYAVVTGLLPLVLLGILAGPTAEQLALGSVATGPVVTALTLCLAVVAVAQLAGGLHDIGRQALYARADDAGPRRAAMAALGGVAAGAAGALAVADGPVRLALLLGALLLGELVAGAVVLRRLHRWLGDEPLMELGGIRRALLAALAALPVALAGRFLLDLAPENRVTTLAVLLAVGSAALAVYALTVRLLPGGRQ